MGALLVVDGRACNCSEDQQHEGVNFSRWTDPQASRRARVVACAVRSEAADMEELPGDARRDREKPGSAKVFWGRVRGPGAPADAGPARQPDRRNPAFELERFELFVPSLRPKKMCVFVARARHSAPSQRRCSAGIQFGLLKSSDALRMSVVELNNPGLYKPDSRVRCCRLARATLDTRTAAQDPEPVLPSGCLSHTAARSPHSPARRARLPAGHESEERGLLHVQPVAGAVQRPLWAHCFGAQHSTRCVLLPSPRSMPAPASRRCQCSTSVSRRCCRRLHGRSHRPLQAGYHKVGLCVFHAWP